jgi:ubiquinone/menaquinone biosynthesis C-methylase UbiE
MASSYDAKYLVFLHGIRERELRAVLHVIDPGSLGYVLELGCGDGFLSMRLKPHCKFLVSADYRTDALGPPQRLDLNFLSCDVEHLPLKCCSFDMIFSSNLLEHVEDIDRALSEMYAAVKKGGIMVHAVPNVTWKVLQLVLYYPFVVYLKVSSLQDKRRHANAYSEPMQPGIIRFESNVKRQEGSQSVLRRIARKLKPSPHGISRNHLEELYRFSNWYWERVFRRNGWNVVHRIRMPFYSPYGFGLNRIRRLCELLGLSSSTCYVLGQGTSSCAESPRR